MRHLPDLLLVLILSGIIFAGGYTMYQINTIDYYDIISASPKGGLK